MTSNAAHAAPTRQPHNMAAANTKSDAGADNVACADPPSGASAVRNHRQPRRRGIARLMLFGGIPTFVVLGLFPTISQHTQLRNHLLNQVVSKFGLTATCESAELGWLTPLSFHNVIVTDEDGRFVVQASGLSLDRSLSQLMFTTDEFGTLTIVESSVEVMLNQDGSWPIQCRTPGGDRTGALQFEGVSFVLSVPWRELPIVDLGGVNISGTIEQTEQGKRLVLERTVLLDHSVIAQSHSDQNMALVAPVLAQTTNIEGEASAVLEHVEIWLNESGAEPPPLRIAGTMNIHHLTARLKPHWVRQLTQFVGSRHGDTIPDSIQMLENSRVDFTVTKAGIEHSGLVFVLPDIADDFRITSSGIVSLDETIDLTFELDLPKLAGPTTPAMEVISGMASGPIRVSVVGTVDDPELKLPAALQLLDMFSAGLAEESDKAVGKTRSTSVPAAVTGLIRDVSQSDDDPSKPKRVTRGVFGLIRAIAESREQKDQSGAAATPSGK